MIKINKIELDFEPRKKFLANLSAPPPVPVAPK